MDLSEFLLALIAEDEAVARAATAGPWIPDEQGWRDAKGEWIIVAPYHELDISDEDAKHVTRWQPGRVLAECDAKRRIVALADFADEEGAQPVYDRALRALALPYADHPDYDPAWRP